MQTGDRKQMQNTVVGIKLFRRAAEFTAVAEQHSLCDPLRRPELAEAILGFSVEPEDAYFQTVSWSSSDETVATVSEDGTVYAVGPGTVTITAQSQEDPALGGTPRKATYQITVQQSVTDIELDNTELRIGAGGKGILTAAVLPENAGNRAVSFESSNPEAVTVDARGNLTAVASGVAEITATAQDGSGASAVTTSDLFIGDGKEFATLFRCGAFELSSTDIGGDAWRTDSTELRGITRLGVSKFDAEAMVRRQLTIEA